MDKRAIFGIALSILVLVVYQDLVSRFFPAPPPGAPTSSESKDAVKAPDANSSAAKESPAAVAVAQEKTAPAEAGTGQPAREINAETENYRAVFTTQGARLKSFKFKKYRTSGDANSPPFEMIQTAAAVPMPLGCPMPPQSSA